MPARIRVEVEGLRELARKAKGDELIAEPWAAAMREIGEAGERAVRAAAPVDTGRLKGKVRHKVQAKPLPRWVAFRAPATRSSARYKRYPYPKRLEYDPSSRHKGWMKRAVESVRPALSAALAKASREIERKWG